MIVIITFFRIQHVVAVVARRRLRRRLVWRRRNNFIRLAPVFIINFLLFLILLRGANCCAAAAAAVKTSVIIYIARNPFAKVVIPAFSICTRALLRLLRDCLFFFLFFHTSHSVSFFDSDMTTKEGNIRCFFFLFETNKLSILDNHIKFKSMFARTFANHNRTDRTRVRPWKEADTGFLVISERKSNCLFVREGGYESTDKNQTIKRWFSSCLSFRANQRYIRRRKAIGWVPNKFSQKKKKKMYVFVMKKIYNLYISFVSVYETWVFKRGGGW